MTQHSVISVMQFTWDRKYESFKYLCVFIYVENNVKVKWALWIEYFYSVVLLLWDLVYYHLCVDDIMPFMWIHSFIKYAFKIR